MDELAALIEQRPGFIALWVFVFGAIIGSFLNVVVYRLPRGLSLNHPGSRCPICEHAIRWYHNVPIVGWLMLRGKCYDCGAKISARYPLVELFTALMFVALGYLDVYQQRPAIGPIDGDLGERLSVLAMIYAADLFVSCCLLSAVLIRSDGQRVPAILTTIGLVAAGLLFFFAPQSTGLRGLVQGLLLAGLLWINGGQIADDLARQNEEDLARRRKGRDVG